MKRDWDTIRELLIKIESLENPDEGLSLDGFDCPDVKRAAGISYHMDLLIQKEFVKGRLLPMEFGTTVGGPSDFFVRSLTWEGNDFLDAIRGDTVWSKTKETFKTQGVNMTFETIKAVASAVGLSMLGLS